MLEQKFEQLPSNNGERYKHLLFLFGAIPLYEQVSKVDFTQINVPDLFASHLMNSIMLSYPPTTSDQFILSAHAIQRFGDRFGVYHMHHMFYFLQCSKLEYEDRSMCYFSYRYMLFACERRTTTDNIAYYFVITVMNSR
jgi:hypothetical protein